MKEFEAWGIAIDKKRGMNNPTSRSKNIEKWLIAIRWDLIGLPEWVKRKI